MRILFITLSCKIMEIFKVGSTEFIQCEVSFKLDITNTSVDRFNNIIALLIMHHSLSKLGIFTKILILIKCTASMHFPSLLSKLNSTRMF